jgi:hypothetical protein
MENNKKVKDLNWGPITQFPQNSRGEYLDKASDYPYNFRRFGPPATQLTCTH